MIDTKVSMDRIRHVYDRASLFYRASASVFDRKARRLGLERAGIEPGDDVLEVGIGPGITLREISARVAATRLVLGLDLSRRMLDLARRGPNGGGAGSARLVQADAERIPLRDASFDVLLSCYLLDLMPLRAMPVILAEFLRVLRPGGRLVVVSMSKKDELAGSWWESLYRRAPSWAAAWVLGGCRPVTLERSVAEAGFGSVRRELVRQIVPSEIVTARRPAA